MPSRVTRPSHRIRLRNPYRPKWRPPQADIDATVRKFFAYVPDDFIVMRAQVIGKAVALALGATWSPALALQVRESLKALGGRFIVFDNRRLVCRICPQQFTHEEAIAHSMALRGRKTPPKGRPHVAR